MSTADDWDLTVPEDPAELLAELRRHGVGPGQRVHLHVHREVEAADERAPVATPAGRERFRFAGVIKDAPSDLARNMDGYLKTAFNERASDRGSLGQE